MVKVEARLFSFDATSEDAGDVSKLDLPSDARVVWFYRNGQFQLADDGTHIQKDDEVVIATHSANLETLQERCGRMGRKVAPLRTAINRQYLGRD